MHIATFFKNDGTRDFLSRSSSDSGNGFEIESICVLSIVHLGSLSRDDFLP
jgi:hypothetical protein